MRVLIEVSTQLGDMIIDIALMRILVKGLDDCNIEVVTSDHIASAIEDCAFIHDRHIYSPGKLGRKILVNYEALSQDWDIFLQLNPRGSLRWAQPWLRAQITRYPQDSHASLAESSMWEHRLSMLAGIVPNYMELLDTKIPLLEGRDVHALSTFAIKTDAKILTVAPGAGHGHNTWPTQCAIEVINAVRKDFDNVLILGRAVNNSICRRIATATDSVSIGGVLPLPYTLALLGRSNLHLGTDNCLSQAAAASGTPTLAIGGHRGGYTCPWRQQEIRGNPDNITTKEILAQVAQLQP